MATKKDIERRLAAALKRQATLREKVRELNAQVRDATGRLPGLHVEERYRFAPGQKASIGKLIERAQKASDELGRASEDVLNLEALAAEPKTAHAIVFSRPSGYWYAWALDGATGKRIADATAHSRAGALSELRGKFSMMGIKILSTTDQDPYA